MLKPPDSSSDPDIYTEYWEAKALLLRILDTTAGQQLWKFFARKDDEYDEYCSAFQFTPMAKSQRACALLGIPPTQDNKVALCAAVKRIAAQEESDAYRIGK